MIFEIVLAVVSHPPPAPAGATTSIAFEGLKSFSFAALFEAVFPPHPPKISANTSKIVKAVTSAPLCHVVLPLYCNRFHYSFLVFSCTV